MTASSRTVPRRGRRRRGALRELVEMLNLLAVQRRRCRRDSLNPLYSGGLCEPVI